MRTLIVFFAVIAIAAAGSGDRKNKKSDGHKFELKCQGQVISFPEEMKNVTKTCYTKIFGDKKLEGKKMKDGETKKQKPTEDEIKEKKKNMRENFQKNVMPKLGCSFVCKAKALKLVNEDGKINKENFVKMVEKSITKKDLSSKLIAEAQKCLTATPNILFKEDTCTETNGEILKVLQCVRKSSKQICGIQDKDINEAD